MFDSYVDYFSCAEEYLDDKDNPERIFFMIQFGNLMGIERESFLVDSRTGGEMRLRRGEAGSLAERGGWQRHPDLLPDRDGRTCVEVRTMVAWNPLTVVRELGAQEQRLKADVAEVMGGKAHMAYALGKRHTGIHIHLDATVAAMCISPEVREVVRDVHREYGCGEKEMPERELSSNALVNNEMLSAATREVRIALTVLMNEDLLRRVQTFGNEERFLRYLRKQKNISAKERESEMWQNGKRVGYGMVHTAAHVLYNTIEMRHFKATDNEERLLEMVQSARNALVRATRYLMQYPDRVQGIVSRAAEISEVQLQEMIAEEETRGVVPPMVAKWRAERAECKAALEHMIEGAVLHATKAA